VNKDVYKSVLLGFSISACYYDNVFKSQTSVLTKHFDKKLYRRLDAHRVCEWIRPNLTMSITLFLRLTGIRPANGITIGSAVLRTLMQTLPMADSPQNCPFTLRDQSPVLQILNLCIQWRRQDLVPRDTKVTGGFTRGDATDRASTVTSCKHRITHDNTK